MGQDLNTLQEELTDLEKRIKETIHNISELDAKMNMPEFTSSDIEIFIMNKKMEQDSLREYMQDKKSVIKKIAKLKD